MKHGFLLLLFVLVMKGHSYAQCAMCKAVASDASKGNNEMAEGMNSGILYLMGFPYLLIIGAGIALYFYFKKVNKELV